MKKKLYVGMAVVFTVLLISSSFLIALPSAEAHEQSTEYDEVVEVEPPEDAGETERDTYVYTYTLVNVEENDTIHIEVETSNEVGFSVEAPENVSVEGEVSVEVEVEVTIDEDAERGDMTTITLEAESEATGEVEKGSMYVAFKDIGDFEPPVDREDAEALIGKAKNAAAFGAVTFLRVEGYEPWAALVVNAGDPRGVDAVTVSFEDGTLIIEAEDENETNHVTILINKEFADKYLGESEGDIDIEVSDAVNYKGLDNSNASAGGGAMYVFHIEHFSTQTIEMSSQPDFTPPVDGADAVVGRAKNAAAYGAVTFLRVEGYEPWAALVINAGDPAGVDAVTVSFEDGTLIIEAEDENDANSVTILVNKAFADEHIADSEGDLDIEVSDAVNYEGMENSNASAGGGAVYVFHIEHFSTQTIEISEANALPFLGTPMLLLALAVPVAYYYYKKKDE
ncbi:MAG: hypothetical protein ACOC55_00870 [Candidatus Natronoplasma sp.]